MGTISASINPCFTAGNKLGVGNCHAAWQHQKTTVCTSIVYVHLNRVILSACLINIITGKNEEDPLYHKAPDKCWAVCAVW
jgi:hypothetical protein